MCDKARKDKIRNEHIRKHLGVSSIGNKLRKLHLNDSENVQCRYASCWQTRKRGKQKRAWLEAIQRKDKLLGFGTTAQDRNRIHVAIGFDDAIFC